MINRQKFQIRLLVLVSLVLTTPAQVFAQGGKPEINKYAPMTKEVPLADMPTYTGSKFQSGATITGPGAGGAISYSEKFLSKDTIDQVGKWYADKLPSSGWTVTLANRSSVFAKKGHASVTVNFNGTHEADYHCVFTINYTPGS